MIGTSMGLDPARAGIPGDLAHPGGALRYRCVILGLQPVKSFTDSHGHRARDGFARGGRQLSGQAFSFNIFDVQPHGRNLSYVGFLSTQPIAARG